MFNKYCRMLNDFHNVLESFDPKQIINVPTQLSNSSMSLIDIIVTNLKTSNVNVVDHFVISCSFPGNLKNTEIKLIFTEISVP